MDAPAESAERREEMEVAMQQVSDCDLQFCLLFTLRDLTADFLSSGARQHHGVLPDAPGAELHPGSVQHLPLQPFGRRASWQGRRALRSVTFK